MTFFDLRDIARLDNYTATCILHRQKYFRVSARMEDADEPNSMTQPFTYTLERVIGNGSFGVVYQAVTLENSETVAIKKVFQDKRYKNRELEIMRELHHPNIVIFMGASVSDKNICMVRSVLFFLPILSSSCPLSLLVST
jgi:serine/threonine protein kinase